MVWVEQCSWDKLVNDASLFCVKFVHNLKFMLNSIVCRVYSFQTHKILFLKESRKCKFNNMNIEPGYNTRSASSRSVKSSNNKNEKKKVDLSSFKIQKKPKLVHTEIQGDDIVSKTVRNTSNRVGNIEIEKDDKNIINQKQTKTKRKRTMQNSDVSIRSPVNIKNEGIEKQIIKREHIKIEYDPVSPTKMKNEDLDDPKKHIKTEIKSEGIAPLNWDIMLNNLREMRKNFDAPVDSMGCHKSCDENAPPKVITCTL